MSLADQINEAYRKELIENERFQEDWHLSYVDFFKKEVLPHRKLEHWKYTSIEKKINPRLDIKVFSNSSKKKSIEIVEKKCLGDFRVVFIDGIFEDSLSKLPKEIILENKNHFTVNNNDYFENLSVLCSQKPCFMKWSGKGEDVLNILHIATEQVKDKTLGTSLFFEFEEHSSSIILEKFVSFERDLKYDRFHTTFLDVKDNSKVTYVKFQEESLSSVHVSKVRANVFENSNLKTFVFSVGGELVRNNIELVCRKKGANAEGHGLFILNEKQHCDNYSVIEHQTAFTTSEQLFKGVLSGQSRGIFNGKILIQKNAEKSSSNQLNKNLLLSKKAHVTAKPQLEVYNDDVKCAHGATTGQVNEEEIFYLESRGIDRKTAMKRLTIAFINDVVLKIDNFSIESQLKEALFQYMEEVVA